MSALLTLYSAVAKKSNLPEMRGVRCLTLAFNSNTLRSESGGSVGKLKLSSQMKEKFEAAVTGGGGGGSRRDSMKSSNEEEVGKLGEDRKKILEQKLRGSSSGGGAGESKETLSHHRARLNCRSQVARILQASSAGTKFTDPGNSN